MQPAGFDQAQGLNVMQNILQAHQGQIDAVVAANDSMAVGALQAIQQAGAIDDKKVEAQQARRVLDRLVGYKASPVLWKTVKKGISAGRVQTVALRLIVEREREIRAFNPVEYWSIEALLEKAGQRFTAKLHQIDGKKAEIHNASEAATSASAVSGPRRNAIRSCRPSPTPRC